MAAALRRRIPVPVSSSPITLRRDSQIHATVFNIQREDAASDTSRQIAFNDEFLSLASSAGATVVIPTPYNVNRMYQLTEQSNMLPQCIEAYVTNIVTTGWEVEPLFRGKVVNDGERVELESFLDNANSQEGLVDVFEKVVRDRETVGFGFLEVIRDASRRISLLRYAPSLYTRLCAKDPQDILVEYTIQRGRRVSVVKEYRRFRRFIQIMHGKMVWFKEFGDPRKMDYTNGAFEGQSGYQPGREATEILHFKLPSNEAYGVPRWISQLPNIMGSREAEEVNMRYFQDNTVPPMMLMVGNGRLTVQSYQDLKNTLNRDEIGSKRQNKIMLIEAVGESDSLDGKGSPIDLKIEKLTDTRQSDGLFKSYDEGNMAKVRSAYRLPPIIVGMSQDVSFATASTSAFVAESQVFGPERERLNTVLNKLLINGADGLYLTTCKLVSRIPAITSPEMFIKTLTALNVMGAVTPRAAQTAANKVLQVELPPYPEKDEEGYEEWMDKPIVFSAKAGAGPNGGPATHEEQGQKTNEIKGTEGEGEVGAKQPEHGSE